MSSGCTCININGVPELPTRLVLSLQRLLCEVDRGLQTPERIKYNHKEYHVSYFSNRTVTSIGFTRINRS